MLIRSFFNAKGDPYYVLGFENEAERTRMFEALNQSDVFLAPLGKRMEFSELVRQLERRDTSHLAMKGTSIAMPLRGQEMNRLLEGIGEILLEAARERAARDQQDKVLEMMAQIFPFDEESGAV